MEFLGGNLHKNLRSHFLKSLVLDLLDKYFKPPIISNFNPPKNCNLAHQSRIDLAPLGRELNLQKHCRLGLQISRSWPPEKVCHSSSNNSLSYSAWKFDPQLILANATIIWP